MREAEKPTDAPKPRYTNANSCSMLIHDFNWSTFTSLGKTVSSMSLSFGSFNAIEKS
jgi:hypothetical protein